MPAQGGWCAKIEVRDGPRLAALLRRCAAWAGALLPEESRFALVEETGGLYAARIEGESPFVLRLESDHLLLAADPSSARCAPALVNALPGRCLAWRILPGPGVREALSVSRTGMLLAFLREESGAVVLGDGQLRLEAEGKCAPLGLALLAGLELSGDPGAGGEAKATLRRFLEAQHSYRALGFAALNGRPAGFAPGFAELVEDRGEGGPLGPWFDSFLPISEDCTFSEVASLAASGGWFRGYRWYFAAAIGARAVDPAREFAILAVPRDPEVDPALLMREDGRIWRRQAETLTLRRPIAVPSDPAKEGWTLD